MNTCMSISILISNYNILNYYQIGGSIIMFSLIYWNGIYFMKEALIDYIKFR
jgi:hypothetical protein